MERKDMPGEGASSRLFPIVGIGASAGGLESLQRFLSSLPKEFSFAPVFIQHLSSKHKSLLPELLSAKRPSLVIQEISDGLKVQPGRLYLAPPGREVRLRNGLFQTTIHPEGLIHLPIDEFLASLAEDAGERSIAVIFSGAGTDGARGCQAVRSVGGTVFVQDPETAVFNSMPLAAMATGQADAVLSPEDIAAELMKLQGIGQAAVSREFPISPEEYGDFFRLLQEKTGSRFNHYKKSVVSRRIKRRIYLHGLSSVKDYLDLISTKDSEAAQLASDLMIGVTSFFRDRVAWKALNLEAVRKVAAESTSLPVRVWTPASATGEEAYSIAMMLLRELALTGKKREVQVFATDVNDRALERAREGRYPATITADVPQEYVQKYFTSTADNNFLVISKDVRESVVFARQDLLTDPPFSKLDLIICRNFMIYLEPEAQEKCIRLFHYALNNGGYLFLGNAETVGRKNTLFKSIGHKQCRVYRKLETKPSSRLPISVPYAAERQSPPAKQALVTEQSRSIVEIIQEKLLEEYGPASVAINQNYDIVYHNGPTNRYLHQPRGVPTQNLLELVPENLRSRIRGALYRSGREERPVAIRTSMTGDDSKKRHVTLRITKAAENLSIVVFREKAAPSKEKDAEVVDTAVIEETAIHQLESELSATRQDLHSHIEQLKSLNEELQSSNEELQAANEELETSREELQSLNEELITVNSQLQGKIEEQDVTNNDLNNFLAGTNIPTIFLDTHFRVKRFTPAMLKLIKLLPSDVGRPIVDMSQENLGPDLTSDAQSVLEQLMPLRRELEIGGAWYVRTALPYRTADNRIEGVVITYNDVTELKRAEERTRHLASFPQLNPSPVIEVDASGKVTFINPGAERILESLGLDKGEVAVFLPKDLGVLLQDLEKNGESSVSREVSVKDRVFNETVQLVPQFKVARIYAYDITERKQAEEALRASEEHFRTLADSIPNLAWWANGDGYITWYNRRWYEYTGTTPEQMEGWGWQSVHDPKVLPEVLERWKTSIATGEPFDMEFPLRGADGVFRSFLTRVLPMKDSAGSVLRWFGTNTDISALKQAEEAQGRLAAIVESAEDAIIGKDLNGIIQTWNVGAEKIFGYTAEEVIGKSISLLVPPGHTDEVPGILERIKQGEHVENFETLRMRKDGTNIPVSLKFSAIKDANGRVVGASKIAHDITERKRAEEALRLSEEKFSLAFANNPAAIALTRLEDGMFLDVNDTWLALNGYSRDEVIGHSARKMPIWPSAEAATRFIHELREKGVLRGWEQEFLKKSGEVFVAQLSAQALTVRGEQVVLSTFVDITERKRAEEARSESEARFRLALKNSPVSVAIQDNNLVYQWAYNQRTRRPDEVVGKTDADLFAPEDLPPILEAKRRVLESGIEEHTGMWLTHNGRRLFFDLYYEPMRDASGNITGVGIATVNLTDQKLAEEALTASESKYRSLFENMIDGLAYHRIVTDENGKPVDYIFLEANEAFEKLTGLKRADIIGKSVREALPGIESDPADWIGTYGKVALTGQEVRFQHYAALLGKWYSVSAYSPMKGYFVAIFEDITEGKKAEAALRRNEERFRSMFERHQAVMLLVEPESGAIVDANAAASMFYGYPPERLRAMRIQDINQLKPEDVAAELRAAAAEKRNHFIFPHLLADGRVRWVEVYSTPFEAQGRPLLFSVIHDITERKQAEEALKNSLRRFELSALTANVLLQSTEPQKVVTSICLKVMEYLDCHVFFNFLVDEKEGRLRLNACAGIPEEEARRLEWLDFGIGVCGCAARDGERIVAEHISNTPDERTELIKSYGIHAFCCHPLLGPGGKVIGSLSFGTRGRETFSPEDLSLMKAVADQVAVAMMRMRGEQDILKLSEDMAARNLELETVNKELESFVYSVSHDLRAPLRSVSGFAKILVEDYVDKLDAQASDYLARIYSGSEKMSQRIDALLHLSRISRQDLNRSEVALSRVASAIVFDLRQANPGRNVEAIIAEGLTASADLNLVKVALSNLFENAWKFTSKTADARIEFGALDKEGQRVYYVKDNGAGFDPEYADRMFWPFHRLHSDQEFEGTGIGLAIVERAIRRHGGRIWAEGEPGKGATFYFTL